MRGGSGVAVGVGLEVAVGVTVGVGVTVAVSAGDCVAVGVAASVGDSVAVATGVAVAVDAGRVLVAVATRVGVGESSASVAVAVGGAVAVGDPPRFPSSSPPQPVRTANTIPNDNSPRRSMPPLLLPLPSTACYAALSIYGLWNQEAWHAHVRLFFRFFVLSGFRDR
jgi:hypothetical protein